jgi:hypothetical protein
VKKQKDEVEAAEAAQAALREGLERAHELVCEARFVIGNKQAEPGSVEDSKPEG